MRADKLAIPTYLTRGRFEAHPSGIYDSWGRHYISRAKWLRLVSEHRADWRNHKFVLGSPVQEPDVPAQWGRRQAACTRCGEHRLVFHAVDMRILNLGWCTVPRSRFLRFLVRMSEF